MHTTIRQSLVIHQCSLTIACDRSGACKQCPGIDGSQLSCTLNFTENYLRTNGTVHYNHPNCLNRGKYRGTDRILIDGNYNESQLASDPILMQAAETVERAAGPRYMHEYTITAEAQTLTREGTCPTSPTFEEGSIGPDSFSGACSLTLPVYSSGVCPGPSCEDYEDYWSVEKVMTEKFPNCTKENWPKSWQPAQSVVLRGGCTVAAWQQTSNGALCPDPNVHPLPCPGLNVSSKDNTTIAMATCGSSGSQSSGSWTGNYTKQSSSCLRSCL